MPATVDLLRSASTVPVQPATVDLLTASAGIPVRPLTVDLLRAWAAVPVRTTVDLLTARAELPKADLVARRRIGVQWVPVVDRVLTATGWQPKP